MNLRDQAELDNSFLVEDSVSGFGSAIKLTDLQGVVYNVTGIYNRIGVDIDPETGLLVAGKKSTITVRASNFSADNLPNDGWTVETLDIMGKMVNARISFVMPDLTAGRITAILKR